MFVDLKIFIFESYDIPSLPSTRYRKSSLIKNSIFIELGKMAIYMIIVVYK